MIGIATFSNESKTGNFNFLRDINELKDLMSKNNIANSQDKISNLWRAGLNAFNSKRYKKSINYFNQAKALNKNHPTADEFIALSEESIARGESLEGFAGFIKDPKSSNVLLLLFGSMSIGNFMSAGFLSIIPLFSRGEKNFPS